MTRDIKHIGKQITFNDQYNCFPHTMLQPGDLLAYGDGIVREFRKESIKSIAKHAIRPRRSKL